MYGPSGRGSMLSCVELCDRLVAMPEKRIRIRPLLGRPGSDCRSLTFRLGPEFASLRLHDCPAIDSTCARDLTPLKEFRPIRFRCRDLLVLAPGSTVLGMTLERLQLPRDISAEMTGLSSLGRIGFGVHLASGMIPPGFAGRLVLELTNFGSVPLGVHVGMAIAQILFFRCDTESPEEVG